MPQMQITMTVKVAWWLRWYLAGVYMAAVTTGMKPDPDRVTSVVLKALTLKVQ